jgi:TM2 domain-containing membrane protein YozV
LLYHKEATEKKGGGTSMEWNDEFDLRETLGEVRVRRMPSGGIAAVLSVLVPGLGHVYAGRLLAGAGWFLATTFAYWAILVPGFLLHGLSIWSAYRVAEEVGER